MKVIFDHLRREFAIRPLLGVANRRPGELDDHARVEVLVRLLRVGLGGVEVYEIDAVRVLLHERVLVELAHVARRLFARVVALECRAGVHAVQEKHGLLLQQVAQNHLLTIESCQLEIDRVFLPLHKMRRVVGVLGRDVVSMVEVSSREAEALAGQVRRAAEVARDRVPRGALWLRFVGLGVVLLRARRHMGLCLVLFRARRQLLLPLRVGLGRIGRRVHRLPRLRRRGSRLLIREELAEHGLLLHVGHLAHLHVLNHRRVVGIKRGRRVLRLCCGQHAAGQQQQPW
mmetsp:Transcript_26716/g.55007  ORF Transcript_26716/g.55007 Transcript_26716/m.55007 type:complete len:287 (+) Transcript_26716:828-1688(+)